MDQKNAGLRLWEAQMAQGTGLCVGLDPHVDPGNGKLGSNFYTGYGRDVDQTRFSDLQERFGEAAKTLRLQGLLGCCVPVASLIAGVTTYFLDVIDAAWACGIRVFKPQAAFYEQFLPFGSLMLHLLCEHLRLLGLGSGEVILIYDAKRGDIATTQAPYYAAYLTEPGDDVVSGLTGQYGFDAMTVTTWMGDDVLTPGLPFFKNGKGAIIVTRTSNPSGTTLQDALIDPNPLLLLSTKQQPFQLTAALVRELTTLLHRRPTVCEAMMHQTTRFSAQHGLDQDGVSPLFSVIGATTRMDDAYRLLRPNGIALVPGFGAQKGQFANVMPLHVPEGPLNGHLGILSSSRAHNFPWMTEYGGDGNPLHLKAEMERAIAQFRKDERMAYETANLFYPFN